MGCRNMRWKRHGSVLLLLRFVTLSSFVDRSALAWSQQRPNGAKYGGSLPLPPGLRRRPRSSSRATTVVVVPFASPVTNQYDDDDDDENSSVALRTPTEVSEDFERKEINENDDDGDGEERETNIRRTANARTTSGRRSDAAVDETDGFAKFTALRTPLLAEVLVERSSGADDGGGGGADGDEADRRIALSGVAGRDEDSSVAEALMSRKERYSELIVVALATCSLVGILGDLLSNYEWVQTLRYFWPLSLGAYYGLLLNQAYDETDRIRRSALREEFGPSVAFTPRAGGGRGGGGGDDPVSLLLQIGYVFGGFGLFVGGLADAVLPVWMTGPNWITNAGLAPDCAVLLLLLSAGEAYGGLGRRTTANRVGGAPLPAATTIPGNAIDAPGGGMAPLLLRIALWAELYKLGESSLDEVVCGLQALLSAST